MEDLNESSKSLWDFFESQFPDAGFGVFEKAVTHLLDDEEDLSNMSIESANKIQRRLSSLNDDDLREFLTGIMLQAENSLVAAMRRIVIENGKIYTDETKTEEIRREDLDSLEC